MNEAAGSPAEIEQRLAKALMHPVRTRVFALLDENVASPSELAAELDEPLGTVSYHVRILLELGLIELVSTTPRRGAIEHHYRAAKQEWHLSRRPLALDGPGRDELAELIDETLARAREIESRAAVRLAEGDGHLMQKVTQLMLLHYESGP